VRNAVLTHEKNVSRAGLAGRDVCDVVAMVRRIVGVERATKNNKNDSERMRKKTMIRRKTAKYREKKSFF
jgi:hypothetical protein